MDRGWIIQTNGVWMDEAFIEDEWSLDIEDELRKEGGLMVGGSFEDGLMGGCEGWMVDG